MGGFVPLIIIITIALAVGILCALRPACRAERQRHCAGARDFTVPKRCRAFWAASTKDSTPSNAPAKTRTTLAGGSCFGGEGRIRTLEPLLGGYTISNRARSTNYATSPLVNSIGWSYFDATLIL